MAIQEIVKNKKYRIYVPISYNGNQQNRYTETFIGTHKEAKLRESQLKVSVSNNVLIKRKNITVGQLFEEWLVLKKSQIAVKTYRNYENYSKNILSYMGGVKLKNLTTKILENFYNKLRTETTYADKTIKHYYSLINTILNSAVKWDYITTNPNMKVDRIQVKRKEISCYSPEQVETLIACLEKDSIKYKALIVLALDTACRRGEITGLTWEDIDFEKSCININKTTQYVAGFGTFEKDTKNETSNRVIYISETTKKTLLKYRAEQYRRRLVLGNKWQGSTRVFTTDFGSDMHPNTPSAILEKVVKKYNLPKISFHGLRHTSISLQIASGIQAQIISKRAGHSNLSTTHNIYSHFFESEMQEVSQKIDAFLKAPIKKIK